MSDEQKLAEGLRALAQNGPQEPPAYVEQKLLGGVRRQARSRKWAAWGPIAAVAAGIAVVASLSLNHPNLTPATPVVSSDVSIEDVAQDFYPVPGSDAFPPIETAMVVRVELPISSVRLMGFAVSDGASEPVEADVLLGQDGQARGVRFVQ